MESMPEPVDQRSAARTKRTACAALVVAGTLTTTGCLFGEKKTTTRVFVPPPVYAKDPVPVARLGELPAPPEEIPIVEPIPGPEIAVNNPPLPPAPPKPAPAKPPATAKPTPPAVVEVVPPPTPPPSPKPTTIISADERRRMTQELDGMLDRVRKVLLQAEGKTLSGDVATLRTQAQNSLQQAEQTRVQDLVTAVSLARRAESFAMELVQRLP